MKKDNMVILLGDIIHEFHDEHLAQRRLDAYCIKPVSAPLFVKVLPTLLNNGD